MPPSEAGPSDWVLRVTQEPATIREDQVVGQDSVAGIGIRLIRHADGYRVEHDDTGIFDVSADGREVWWHERPNVDWDVLCADITGRVLAVALHIRGQLTLHGSAALIEQQGVSFLAPKGFGKSTISMALTKAGARLASDDMVTVEPGEPVRAWPGLGSLRLLRHTAEALRVVDFAAPREVGHKTTLTQLPPERLVNEKFRLSAIYLLHPMEALPDTGVAVERIRLDSIASVLAVVPNTKLGPLLGGAEAAVVLQRAAELVRSVPVYTLRIVRDLTRLDEVVDQLFTWHGATTGRRVVVGATS